MSENRGRKSRLTIAAVKAALEQCGGIRTATAQMLDIHRSTLFRFIERHRLEAFVEDVEETLKDIAEDRTIQAIRAGDMPTVRWYLEIKGRDRGYCRRVETTGPGGRPVQVAGPPMREFLAACTEEELQILLRAAERREQERLEKDRPH